MTASGILNAEYPIISPHTKPDATLSVGKMDVKETSLNLGTISSLKGMPLIND